MREYGKICGKLIFQLSRTRAVWLASHVGIRSEGLTDSSMAENWRNLICGLRQMDSHVVEEYITYICCLQWLLWKVRNELRFHNKLWEPMDVITRTSSFLAQVRSCYAPSLIA
ncbi:conserved hypothetical protein [Ricinus communis]|uniref:Uncharacterized protein n=1 Tax=Ricinus communis TaxID=3988 RepID=B9RKS2_RICCO|nr:conserved hypothetical protein [Ricinus communis]